MHDLALGRGARLRGFRCEAQKIGAEGTIVKKIRDFSDKLLLTNAIKSKDLDTLV